MIEKTQEIDTSVFEKLGAFPKWTPDDGPAPYVFADRPAGHRCAWSCNWSVSNPNGKNALIVTPTDWGFADINRMTPAQLAAELQDLIYDRLLAALPFTGNGQERMLAASMELQVSLLNGVTSLTENLIRDFRQNFNHSRAYVSPYNPPMGGMVKTTQRPGWFAEELIKE